MLLSQRIISHEHRRRAYVVNPRLSSFFTYVGIGPPRLTMNDVVSAPEFLTLPQNSFPLSHLPTVPCGAEATGGEDVSLVVVGCLVSPACDLDRD